MSPSLLLPALQAAQSFPGVNPDSGTPQVPHWGWYVVLYFFLGGLTAGCYFIASLLDAVGDERDQPAVRLGYLIAFPGIVVCGILLILDLGVPLRFWHMLIQSERPPLPIVKPWSPISIGSWILSAFGFFAFVSFVGELTEMGRIRWSPIVALNRRLRRGRHWTTVAWSAVGAFFGFALAGYTGVLMIGTTRPVWHNAHLLGAVFLASAASTSYALLLLLLHRRPAVPWTLTHKLDAADRWSLIIELVLLLTMLAWLGRLAAPLLTGAFGVLFWLGTVGLGLVVPLVLDALDRRRPVRLPSERRVLLRSACVLVGGLVLRFVVVMAPQWPQVKPWHL